MKTSRWFRILNRFVSLLALALLLLIAAWLASNWHDAPPQPRDAALQLPSATLTDDRNAYFALAGLHAAADREPASAGQALWKLLLARATTTRLTPPYVASAEQPDSATQAVLGKTLPSIPGCDTAMADCVAQWIDKPDGLIEQRKAHALLGQRCERLLDGTFEFDEVLAPMTTVAEPLAQHGIGASNCSRWLLGGAVLAWVRRDHASTVALLAKADRMSRALLSGSHSLIGQMIAIRIARNSLGTMAALGVRDPNLSTALMPLLAPLPDQVQSAKRWMVVEAAFNRGVNAEMSRAVSGQSALIMADGEPTPVVGGLFEWLIRHHIGWHPERNEQAIDAFWLRSIRQLDEGLVASIHARATKGANQAEAGMLDLLRWRNTFGNMVFSIGQSGYGGYLARHADLELHREATMLALRSAAGGVPAADRHAWLVRQPMSPTTEGRFTWSHDGLVLVARAWQQPFSPGAYDAKRDAIRITWPSPR
jgi:hypothetical protein